MGAIGRLHGGVAKFYNGKLFRFYSRATGPNIKIRLAAEELAKKAGKPTRMTTFGGDYSRSCAASVAIHLGEASVVSESILLDLVELYQQGNHQETCSESIFLKKAWESVVYDCPSVTEAITSELIQQRDLAERKAAGKVKL